ncbi:UDP-N-acetylmuramate--L-alanine ligase [Futiania mangrovi]|uniref:UDP-N-acetylmuramate--L-alanine ligase n=1 Tax=Futiania mangrovi TaxID=2959716 RepID=A0A9J6PFR6_9PROT|nr:UDP-N-acetylmuramate--L-alanine ligase [Futiania mangrovii]MCP1334954.1 UDP-N-acetylmuramate--L-alanine ligase [Futiania mangrovii]
MSKLPLDIGLIHFVGIGGIGMSGIAEVMRNLGHKVQGSDVAESANVRRLRAMGIPVEIGHRAENLGEARVIVVSSAIRRDNPELVEARARHLPVVRRAEMLAELMRLKNAIAVGGTHGKTTTTSMVAALLDAADIDPTVINGGIINAYGTNARLGAGEWMVVEADESDGTFVKLPATITIVTNMDPEHLDHYGSYDAMKAAYRAFVENVPFYGVSFMCIDHPEVQALVGRIEDRRVVTYGMNPQADVRAVNLRPGGGGTSFDVIVTNRRTNETRTLKDMHLPMPGAHNVQNALSAIAVALELGIKAPVIHGALAQFGGVKRRFTEVGVWNGVRIIDDYGHHPVEISAVLKAAREACQGRVVAVVQPHRFTRLQSLFEDFCRCFNDADTVIVTDVYPAGESPIEGVDRDALVAGVRAHGHRDVLPLETPDDLASTIARRVSPGDMVVCLGAGNITQWANALPDALADLKRLKEACR